MAFLMQSPLSGRKSGHLIDLGGQMLPDEQPSDAAQRQFLEEGGRFLFSAKEVREYFTASQLWTPGFRVERKKRNWTLYLMRIPAVELGPANEAHWEQSTRREFFWVPKSDLLEALAQSPEDPPTQPSMGIPGHCPALVWARLAKIKKKLKKTMKNIEKHSRITQEFQNPV